MPENTKMAFMKALDLGADAIEFDVQLTRDGHAIVFHDDILDRTTNGRGLVADTDFATIRKLDAGSWFGAAFADAEVPTLEETLKVLGGRTTLNVELKPDGRADRLVKHVITAVARFDLWDSVIFSSFDGSCIRKLRELVPGARLGVLCTQGRLDDALEFARFVDAENLHPPVALVDNDLVARAHAQDLKVWTWTANSPGEIALLTMLGVDGIFTDFPDRVSAGRRRCKRG
jgi:glycerophosphoryl diester phosphodiesterase